MWQISTVLYRALLSSGRGPYVLKVARVPNGLYNFHSCCSVVEAFLLSNFPTSLFQQESFTLSRRKQHEKMKSISSSE